MSERAKHDQGFVSVLYLRVPWRATRACPFEGRPYVLITDMHLGGFRLCFLHALHFCLCAPAMYLKKMRGNQRSLVASKETAYGSWLFWCQASLTGSAGLLTLTMQLLTKEKLKTGRKRLAAF